MNDLGARFVSLVAVASAIALASPAPAATSLEAGAMGSVSWSGAGARATLETRVGPVRPSTLGPEFHLSLFGGSTPTNWSGSTVLGVLGALVDVDLAYAMPLSGRVTWVPRLGGTVFGAGGEGGGGVSAGLNAGVGIVMLPERGTGVRADLGYRLVTPPSFAEGLWQVSIGLVWSGASDRRDEHTRAKRKP